MARVVVKRVPKGKTTGGNIADYLRLTPKSCYFSNGAMKLIPNTEFISFILDIPGYMMKIVPQESMGESSFKISRVNETEYARRIETNNVLISLIKSGFPVGMLGKRLPVIKGLDGSLIVDLRPQIPLGSGGGENG